jgi:hypothetical protein
MTNEKAPLGCVYQPPASSSIAVGESPVAATFPVHVGSQYSGDFLFHGWAGHDCHAF